MVNISVSLNVNVENTKFDLKGAICYIILPLRL